MARGGKRSGAGRKKGSKAPKTVTREKLTSEIALKALAANVTPLEVMIEAMHDAYKAGGAMVAAPFAKECAPYVHPKLSNIEANLGGSVGHYEAQPIAVEERNSTRAVARAARAAAHGDSA